MITKDSLMRAFFSTLLIGTSFLAIFWVITCIALCFYTEKPQVRMKATPALRDDDSRLKSILKQEAIDSEYAKLWNTDI